MPCLRAIACANGLLIGSVALTVAATRPGCYLPPTPSRVEGIVIIKLRGTEAVFVGGANIECAKPRPFSKVIVPCADQGEAAMLPRIRR